MYTFTQLLEQIHVHIANLPFKRTPESLYIPVEYILALPSKRIRPALMLMAYNLYREDVEQIYPQAVGIEVFHNFTLLHDDLMDRAELRRGQPTVHRKWNDSVAILSGDAMLVVAYRYITDCQPRYVKPVVDLFNATALEVCEGQQMDMDFETRADVTVTEYLEMIRLKTAVLLAGSLKMGAILADAPEADAELLYQFGINIGIAFQLEDDLLDVYGDVATFGKNIGGDILCNKKTYLLLKAMEHADSSQRQRLTALLNDTDNYTPNEKITAVTTLYNEIGVREICRQAICEYSRAAEECLNRLSIPPNRRTELEQIKQRLMNRQV
ncbi:MAG: polyprenyl synthetase family protein [Mediterranea sp.]|jgi:geranylgeranyl diphosphate synthase type II|nr:polyprenyl synthetase family protein [Mediterranea sp.]